MASQSVQPFLKGSPFYINLQNPMLYNAFQWAGQSPHLPLRMGQSSPHLIHDSLGPSSHLTGSAVFAGLANATNRQTDRQTTIFRL